jgi:positive regulator of sigma E activity
MGGLIEHSGIVTEFIGDKVAVQVSLQGCGSCGHQSQCGMGKLTPKKNTQMTIQVDAVANLQLGQQVTLVMPESRISFYALLGYLVPALGFLIGALMGSSAGSTYGTADLGTALGAITLMLFCVMGVRWFRLSFPALFPMPKILDNTSHFKNHQTGYPIFPLHVMPASASFTATTDTPSF